MGCDLYVYYDIDQNVIEEYIKSNLSPHLLSVGVTPNTSDDSEPNGSSSSFNNLDVMNKEDYNKIIHFCKTELIPDVDNHSYLFYKWDRELGIHNLSSSYPVNFIRDDNRFTDKYYHKMFEKKHGVPFPNSLRCLLFGIHDKKDALEIAENLEKYFPYDENIETDEATDNNSNYSLMCFAKWLRQSAKYNLYYELDY